MVPSRSKRESGSVPGSPIQPVGEEPVGELAAIRGLAEATSYLEGLINLERLPDFSSARLNLGPIRALLNRLGNPECGLSVHHEFTGR